MAMHLLFLLLPAARADLLVNELLYNPDGGDDGAEWIELCNSGGATIDLSGFVIESAGSSWGESYTLPDGASIGPGQHLVVGSAAGTWTGSFDPNLQNGGSATDGVRLLDASGRVIDTVLYDSPNDNGLLDDEENSGTSPAPEAGEGELLARWPDCTDTNDSSRDFYVAATGTPGAANAEPDVDTGDSGDSGETGDSGGGGDADCSGADGLKVNELMFTTDAEWVELYNAGSRTIDLSGWEVQVGTNDNEYDKAYALPAGTSLESGAYLLVASAGAGFADAVAIEMDFGNATSGADALRVACNGVGVDTVVYGTLDEDGWTEDDGSAVVATAPKPSSTQSIARVNNGVDTDRSGVDFAAADAPTPGEANPEIICDPGLGLRLNEFVYDVDGADDGLEWIELYNPTGDTLRLDGWVVLAATSADDEGWSGDETVLPPGTTLGPGEFLVVGGEDAENVDVVWDDGNSLGNGTDGDAVRLYDCAGGVIDTVLYGDPMLDGLTDDLGGTDVVPAVQANSGASIGRSADGVDADAAADWEAFGSPTPGAPNLSESDTGGDDNGGGSTGCGGTKNPNVENPNGGCSTGAPRVAGATLLALVALFRRRRG